MIKHLRITDPNVELIGEAKCRCVTDRKQCSLLPFFLAHCLFTDILLRALAVFKEPWIENQER